MLFWSDFRGPKSAGIVIDITIRALLAPLQSPPGYPGASQLGTGGPPGASQIPPIPSGFKMCGFHTEMLRFPQLTKSLPGLLRGSPEAPCDLPRDRRGSLGNHNNPQGLPMVAPGIPGDPPRDLKALPKDPSSCRPADSRVKSHSCILEASSMWSQTWTW